MTTNVWIAFGLTLFAGLATGIGSIFVFVTQRTNYRFLSVATGFSAGVMIYVSFIEIFFKGAEELIEAYGAPLGDWVNVGAFFVGILFIGLIDNLIPERHNPHEAPSANETSQLHVPLAEEPVSEARQKEPADDENDDLMRTGLFTALAIAVHNFPEGLATFLAALRDPALGAAIAVAIALHNIPEGVSVAVPVFYATGERRKGLIYSLLSGLSEPAGALVAYAALRLLVGGPSDVFPPQIMGVLFAAIAGIMVYISVDELLPTSRAYGKGHDSIYGMVAGMAVMAASLLLM